LEKYGLSANLLKRSSQKNELVSLIQQGIYLQDQVCPKGRLAHSDFSFSGSFSIFLAIYQLGSLICPSRLASDAKPPKILERSPL